MMQHERDDSGKGGLPQSGIHNEVVAEIIELVSRLDQRKLDMVHRFIKTLLK